MYIPMMRLAMDDFHRQLTTGSHGRRGSGTPNENKLAQPIPTNTPGKLFVGGLGDAMDGSLLRRRQIKLLITAMVPFGDWPSVQESLCTSIGVKRKVLWLLDAPTQVSDLCLGALPSKSVAGRLAGGIPLSWHRSTACGTGSGAAEVHVLGRICHLCVHILMLLCVNGRPGVCVCVCVCGIDGNCV
eukprot:GHVU01066980.1.p1 GENE.GHVU01066980.1~~GHVU01066980.1.p1  ORF type:complete len:186 (-),score=10.90 GHVU01066980.1:48-605(-)